MTSTGTGDELSFARDIRPLFREKDRDSMMRAFDLFDYADVVEHGQDAVRRSVARLPGRQAPAVD